MSGPTRDELACFAAAVLYTSARAAAAVGNGPAARSLLTSAMSTLTKAHDLKEAWEEIARDPKAARDEIERTLAEGLAELDRQDSEQELH